MPTPRFTSEDLRALHDLATRRAQIVSKRALGNDGPGLDVDFNTFEQIAAAAAHGLTEGTLQLLVQQQADKLPTEQPCPVGDRACPTKPHARPLAARGATVQQVERLAHCPACRRDFFPPADDPGSG